MTQHPDRGPPFVERRSQQRPVTYDRRRPPVPPPRSRRPRGRVFAVEMAVGLLIVVVLTAVALPLYAAHEKTAHDLAAESDLHNAMYVIQVCSAISTTFPQTEVVVAGGTPVSACEGESLVASAGTILTYLPDPGGISFVLLAHNTGGRPAYWCWNQTMGGPIRQVAGATATC